MIDKQNRPKPLTSSETISAEQADRHDSLLTRLRRGSSKAIIFKILSFGALFLMFTSVSRRVSVEQFGIFSYAYMLSSTLAYITPLGWSNAALRFVREYSESENWSLLRGILIRSHQVTIATSVVMGVLLVLISYLPIRENLVSSFRYAALILPLQSLVFLRRKIFLALDQVKASMLVQDVLSPSLVVVLLIFFDADRASNAVLMYVLASLITFCVATYWLRYILPSEGRNEPPTWQTRFWFSVAWPMLLGSVSQVLMQRTDIVMLGLLANMEAVGQYTAASQISVATIFVIGAINAIMAPQLASAYQRKDAHSFKTIFRKSQLWSIFGALPPFLVIIAVPTFLLQLFGNNFTGGVLLLIILSLGQLFRAMTGSADFALLMAEREKQFALSTTTIAVFNIVGNILAISYLGAFGASLVTSTGLIALSVWQYVLVKRIFPQRDVSM